MGEQSHSSTQRESLAPGEYLRRTMALSDLTATALAQEVGVHPQTIYNVTTGKRPISRALAVKLADRFVEPVEVWLSERIEKPVTPIFADGGREEGANQPGAATSETQDRTLVDREIEDLLRLGEGIRITPFNPHQVQPASYDLTIGLIIESGFKSISTHNWQSILRRPHAPDAPRTRKSEHVDQLLKEKSVRYGTEIRLAPGKSVVILCQEEVAFSPNYLADVGSTAHNAINGLLVNHGFQIDPGYRGCIFVTAMNIGQDEILLTAGEKILSLAIRRLARPPERAYRDEIARLVLGITGRVYAELEKLFRCEPHKNGLWKVTAEAFDQTLVRESRDAILHEAINEFLIALGQPGARSSRSARVIAAEDVLESVTIVQEEFLALVQHLKGMDKSVIERAGSHFRSPTDRQTLRDTLVRLDRDLVLTMVELAGGDA